MKIKTKQKKSLQRLFLVVEATFVLLEILFTTLETTVVSTRVFALETKFLARA